MAFDLLGYLGYVAVKKAAEKLKLRRKIRFLNKQVSQLEKEGEVALNQGLYLNSFKYFVEALKLEKINPKPFSEMLESVDQLKAKINLVEYEINKAKINQISLIIEKEDKLKIEKKFDEAYDEYQKAHKLIEEMVFLDGKKRGQKVNDIYLKQIQILIEKGNELKSQNEINEAVEILKKALDLAVRVLTSAERDQLINKIKKNLDTFLDIYSIKIKEKIDLGNKFIEQRKYDESKQVFQIALNLVEQKYSSLSDSMTNRFNQTNEIREINNFINQILLKSHFVKENPMDKDIKSDGIHVTKKQPFLSSKPSILPEDHTPPTKPLPMQTIKVPISTLPPNVKVEKMSKGKEEEVKPKVTQNICDFCGNKLDKKARFCPQCGRKFKKKKN